MTSALIARSTLPSVPASRCSRLTAHRRAVAAAGHAVVRAEADVNLLPDFVLREKSVRSDRPERIVTDETRQKLSQALSGKAKSPEQRIAVSATMLFNKNRQTYRSRPGEDSTCDSDDDGPSTSDPKGRKIYVVSAAAAAAARATIDAASGHPVAGPLLSSLRQTAFASDASLPPPPTIELNEDGEPTAFGAPEDLWLKEDVMDVLRAAGFSRRKHKKEVLFAKVLALYGHLITALSLRGLAAARAARTAASPAAAEAPARAAPAEDARERIASAVSAVSAAVAATSFDDAREHSDRAIAAVVVPAASSSAAQQQQPPQHQQPELAFGLSERQWTFKELRSVLRVLGRPVPAAGISKPTMFRWLCEVESRVSADPARARTVKHTVDAARAVATARALAGGAAARAAEARAAARWVEADAQEHLGEFMTLSKRVPLWRRSLRKPSGALTAEDAAELGCRDPASAHQLLRYLDLAARFGGGDGLSSDEEDDGGDWDRVLRGQSAGWL